MDEREFWSGVRAVSLVLGGILSVLLVIYLVIVAGYATHAYINRIDPDPPYCVTVEKQVGSRGQEWNVTVKHPLTDAGAQ